MHPAALETTTKHGWWSTWLVLGPCFFGLALLGSVSRGFEAQDETWFLQVVHRVVSGEVLYRDVFYGATPLAVYVTLPFVYVFGSEIFVSKAVHAICFLLTLLVSCRVARQLGSGSRCPLWVILPLFIYVSPHADTVGSLYTPLANLCYLLCFSACLSWFDGRGNRALLLAGIAAGLTLAAKQNYGVYVAAALAFSLVLRPPHSGYAIGRRLGVVTVAACGVTAAMLLPVWWSGGLPAFIEFGFTNKEKYLQYAGIGYFAGLRENISPVSLFPYLLPWFTVALLALAWFRADSAAKRRIAIVAVFFGMNCLGMYPRADLSHVRHVVPMCVLAWLFAWHQLGLGESGWALPTMRKALTWCLLAVFGVNLTAILVPLVSPEYQFSTIEHFRGTLLRKDLHADIEAWRDDLHRGLSADNEVFFASTDAAFWYLLTDKRNPTRFDYPLVTAFGQSGESQVASAFVNGDIGAVLLDVGSYEGVPDLVPMSLVRSALEHGERVSEIRFSKLYRRKAAE